MANKEIGKSFKEKLSQLQQSPDDSVWTAIEADLEKKKKRRIVPLWFFFIGIPVFVLILLLTERSASEGSTVFEIIFNKSSKSAAGTKNGPSPETSVQDAFVVKGDEDSEQDEVSSGDQSLKRSDAAREKAMENQRKPSYKNINSATSSKKPNSVKAIKNANGKTQLSVSLEKQKSIAGAKSDVSGIVVNDSITTETDTTAIAQIADSTSVKSEDKKKLLKEQDTTATVKVESTDGSSLSVFIFAGPTIFSHLGESTLDRRLDDNPTRSEVTYNFGGYLTYQYSDRWSFRAGLLKSEYVYITEDVPVNSETGTPQNTTNYTNVDYAASMSNAALSARFDQSQVIDLKQEFTFFEVPVEAKYHLLDSKVFVDILGGISVLSLRENILTAESDSQGSAFVGSTNNMFKVRFAATGGLSFGYKFSDKLKLNIEPLVKYHFKINQNSNNAFSAALQAGLEYSFGRKKKS
ncbi:MAG TPA: hypothetical protein VGB44_09295 [Flavobacterium sp.]|jgi:hypothetical protein